MLIDVTIILAAANNIPGIFNTCNRLAVKRTNQNIDIFLTRFDQIIVLEKVVYFCIKSSTNQDILETFFIFNLCKYNTQAIYCLLQKYSIVPNVFSLIKNII